MINFLALHKTPIVRGGVLHGEQFYLYSIPVDYEPNETMPRAYCGKNPDTKKRYDLLIQNITQYLNKLG